MARIPTALTIAGSDSGGGAGIQADLKTFAVMGVHGMSAITSITAQNTREVRAIHDVPPEVVVAQIEAVADDIGVDAAKTGMLSSRQIIEAIARPIDRYGFPLVVDPVMIAKSGAKLLRDDAIEALKRVIIPRATLVTPNAPEAERLTGIQIRNTKDAGEAARVIVEEYGSEAAIVKGGHLESEYSVDVLYYKGRTIEYKMPRIRSDTTHGTGCSFSAAIAAGLAKGRSLPEAVNVAKRFITMAIEYGLRIGSGHGPVNPVAWQEIPAERYRVLEDLAEALRILASREMLVSRLVPEVQMNIAMAITPPYARTPIDVAAVPGRIARHGDRLIIRAAPEFGASRHLSKLVLAAVKVDPRIRAAGNIVASPEVREALGRLGYTVLEYGGERPLHEDMSGWSRIPDAVVTGPAPGREPLTILFADRASTVAGMIARIAEEAARA